VEEEEEAKEILDRAVWRIRFGVELTCTGRIMVMDRGLERARCRFLDWHWHQGQRFIERRNDQESHGAAAGLERQVGTSSIGLG